MTQKHKPFGHSKSANIERRTWEEREREEEPSFLKRHKHPDPARWEQSAVKKPGATRAYLRRMYGDEAFHKNGTIKLNYLDDAIRKAKERHNTLWEKRLVLARTYKTQ